MKQIQYLDLMRYFVNHYDKEHKLLQAIQADSADKLDLFIKFKNSYMKVGRNFETGNDEKILNDVLAFDHFKGNYVQKLSEHFKNKGFLSKENENALSAASKFLWLKERETIIMDRNNMKVLKVGYDYELYCEKWRQRYSQCRNQIIEITDKHFLENIDPIFGKEWFRMRVFDQFLWSLAKEK